MNQTKSPSNPLLAAGLPRFNRVQPEHALPAIQTRLAEYRRVIEGIERRGHDIDYQTVVVAETLADHALTMAWSTIAHLHAVNSTPAWREAYSACLPELTRFASERGQNRALYRAYQRLAERDDFSEQAAELKATIGHELRDFRLAGVALPKQQRERFAAIRMRLSELSNRFGNHVLDATEGYCEQFSSAAELAGLPPSELDTLSALARDNGSDGWLANLSQPAYRAILTYADDRALRERFHRAHATRASDQGPQAGRYDNGPLVTEILALRNEQAQLLGFTDYAAMGLSTRMAQSAEQVESFLNHLAERARAQAAGQLAELERFAAETSGPLPLRPWDIAYYAEKLREIRLGINQDRLKPWFELSRCLDGLFEVAKELFGLRFEAHSSVEVWHEDVRYFRVLDERGETVAGLFLDLYSRARKSGGAWMDVCRPRLDIEGHRQAPVAYLTCNFAAPAKGRPSLLTHDDLVTLFPEFGHCLHHLLTRIKLPGVGGISGVEWDAVELPSQLLEGWAWEAEALNRYARHIDTGQPLPARWLRGLIADRQFHGAIGLLRQIEFGLIDLGLHQQLDPDPVALARQVHEQIAVVPMTDDNRFIMSFSHLFDGGYAAGYYSYLWAERLARDAFELFRDQGLFNREAGRLLAREILEVGSSRPMADSWLAFRGRDAALEPLLAGYGIVD